MRNGNLVKSWVSEFCTKKKILLTKKLVYRQNLSFLENAEAWKKNDPSEKISTYFTFVGLAFGMIGNYALSGFVFKRS